MSSSLGVSSSRKPSEAKSVDSGYCGPSRETSTALLRKSSDLPIIQEVKEGTKISTQSLSSSHNVFSSFTEEEAVGSSEASQAGLHFTNVSDYQRVASTEASQPSIVQLNESLLSLSLTVSSSESPSQSILQIRFTSSAESQSQPNICTSITESTSHMTAEHESILKRTVGKKMHLFIEHTHFETLLPYLYEKKVVHTEECERLEIFTSNKAKANHFYLVVLPQKGNHAYRRLYKCLKRETEHLGHRDLVEILDKALEEHQSPQSSTDSSPTDSNSADRNFGRKSDDCHRDGQANRSPSGSPKFQSNRLTDCTCPTCKNEPHQNITHQVPFLHFHVLECDYSGVEYIIDDHDITLRIPEGAVPVGESIKFEIGVVLYGPFIFPGKTRPISPIIWICIQEDIELKKPFQLILPHFLIGLKKKRLNCHQVTFAKANHSAYDTEKQYKFIQCVQEPLFVSTESRSYAVLYSTHCCFYCLTANNTPELARKAGYGLARIEATLSPQRSEVYFVAFFFLKTCIKALEEQFCREKEYRICRYDIFRFNTKELCITIVPCDLDQCVIALEPSTAKIRASDIDFWKLGYDYDTIKLQHEKKMYPPRVKMTVMMRSPDHQVFKLPIKIKGCSSDNQLDTELAFPLLRPEIPHSSHSSSSSSSSSSVSSGTVIGMDDKPKERNVFKKLLPLANDWKTIGCLLGVESNVIEKIKKDGDDIHDCLRAMISEWLKQVSPPPTWKELIGAVEQVDSSQAEKMKQYLAC